MPPSRPEHVHHGLFLACAIASPAMAGDQVTLEDTRTPAAGLGTTDGSDLDRRPRRCRRARPAPADPGAQARTAGRSRRGQDGHPAHGQPEPGERPVGQIAGRLRRRAEIQGFGAGRRPHVPGRHRKSAERHLCHPGARVQPTLEGSWGRLVGFRIQAQLAGDTASINDAYVDLRFDPRATVRAGKFKVPFGLEQLEPSGGLAAMERNLPSELTPGRDYGVQLQGEFLQGELNVAVEASNGVPDGRDGVSTNPDNHLEYAGRMLWEPFKNDANAWSGLGFGLAGTVGDASGNGDAVLPRYRAPGPGPVFQLPCRSPHRRQRCPCRRRTSPLVATGVFLLGPHGPAGRVRRSTRNRSCAWPAAPTTACSSASVTTPRRHRQCRTHRRGRQLQGRRPAQPSLRDRRSRLGCV